MRTAPTLAALVSLSGLVGLLEPAARADEGPALEVIVTAPGGTDRVFVALDAPLGGKDAWAPDSLELTRERSVAGAKAERFRGTIRVEKARTVELKLTRGSWATVEKGPKGQELSNHKVPVVGTGLTRFEHTVARWADAEGAAREAAPISSALVDLGSFQPTKLPSKRRVVALLPAGYEAKENAERRYPVLYVLDGQNQFDPKRSFLGIVWGLDAAAAAHVAAGREPFIAVAIDNTPERADEYLPSRDPKRSGGGRLEDFASFLFDELKPKVDARFRTRTGPDDTGVLGSSFGGMAAFHLGWKHADKVRRIGSVSPSLWWNKEETKALVAATKEKPPLRLWLDMGTREGRTDEESGPYLDTVRGVRDALVAGGFTEGKDLGYLEAKGASHDEASWAKRLPEILAFLFPGA